MQLLGPGQLQALDIVPRLWTGPERARDMLYLSHTALHGDIVLSSMRCRAKASELELKVTADWRALKPSVYIVAL